MGFLFTSESVSEGHPDKVSDQISDAILDEFLRRDANSKVACETLCTTGLVVVAGEVRSDAYVDVQGVARRVINRIGYTKSEYQFDCNSCGILSAIHEQSSDINQGVVRAAEEDQGAGDQGIMFGYACNETREMMPATLILSHVILKELAVIRREGEAMTYLRPDSKSQVTIEYDEQTNKPLRVHTIVCRRSTTSSSCPATASRRKRPRSGCRSASARMCARSSSRASRRAWSVPATSWPV